MPKILIFAFALIFIGCSTPTVDANEDEDSDAKIFESTKSSSSFSDEQEDYFSKNISSSSVSSSSVSVEIESSSSIEFSSSSYSISSSSFAEEFIHIEVEESGEYTSRDSVAAYICEFEELPQNYVSKNEGQDLYESITGNTFSKWNFNPWKTLGVMIGGDSFYNNKGLEPDGTYHEADVDYGVATSRGTNRLVYTSGCVIYYTNDHYTTFSKLEVE